MTRWGVDRGVSPRQTARHWIGTRGEAFFRRKAEGAGFSVTKQQSERVGYDWQSDLGVRIESKERHGIFKDARLLVDPFFDAAKYGKFDLIVWHLEDDCACWVFNSAPLQLRRGFSDDGRPDQKRDTYMVPARWCSLSWETMFARLDWLEGIRLELYRKEYI